MPIEKKRYAVADFAIATAAIIEEKSIIKNKRKARGKSTKNGCSGVTKNGYTTSI